MHGMQSGRLSQKHHRQAPAEARLPPTMGPRTVPRETVDRMPPMYFPRKRGGTRSQMIRSEMTNMPAEPVPCMVRPAISMATFIAAPAMAAPRTKRVVAVR